MSKTNKTNKIDKYEILSHGFKQNSNEECPECNCKNIKTSHKHQNDSSKPIYTCAQCNCVFTVKDIIFRISGIDAVNKQPMEEENTKDIAFLLFRETLASALDSGKITLQQYDYMMNLFHKACRLDKDFDKYIGKRK